MERQKISVIFPYFMKGLSKSEWNWFAIMRIIIDIVENRVVGMKSRGVLTYSGAGVLRIGIITMNRKTY